MEKLENKIDDKILEDEEIDYTYDANNVLQTSN